MFARSNRKGKSTTRSKTQSVVAWSISFENLLEDPEGLKTFTEFLRREFSAENITFWLACKQYRQVTDPEEMRKLAKEICDLHLRNGAPEAVNINSQTRHNTVSMVHNPTPDLFSQAEKEVFLLMKFDCYQRFLKSDLFVECLTAEKLGKPLPCSCLSVSKSPTTGARFRSKSREKNRSQSSKKVNSASFVSSSSKDLQAINDENTVTPSRRSFFTYKKDMDAVWNRLQNRMDDQRGMELNCNMPEFLLQ